ncbi:phosphoadenosine phosphosulfate reductase [Chryseobacterium carnipullorum]|uniref:PUA domain (Predicted RNA-binding domain) n=1 Tax=Chryseobacterium carnipullorum TaxID=1124835 RepID=A0A376DSS8_CHRCU|nr:phosphoadenosine phosphosulfate reductase [Chryseobacterium carnipullorum]AZA49553.1 phosphoadenosine phosphosulfate reductase [Chryseobacterium carnipullorum]AZA64450.1 phosphoadenosine phosphosulfate reductase [Chryseobacterium carnipullorum]STC94801.1 PUA domain (predicted RNA-binding domain) [Chryseobacterium carnipullorum]
MKKLLVTVSGGRSSAFMARHIQTFEKYKDFEKVYVFCNTGMERPETIQFLKDIVHHWNIPLNIIEAVFGMVPGVGISHKVVDFETMDMHGKVFSQSIAYMNKINWHGVPNSAIPYCSKYLKTEPSHHFAKAIFGKEKFIKAIGFRAEDMPKRISWPEIAEEEFRIFPNLTDFENPITQFDLNLFFDNEPFKLKLHSKIGNCRFCWKRDNKLTADIIRMQFEGDQYFVDWHRNEEAKFGNTFFRDELTIDDLVKMAQRPFVGQINFEEYQDDDFKCICNF